MATDAGFNQNLDHVTKGKPRATNSPYPANKWPSPKGKQGATEVDITALPDTRNPIKRKPSAPDTQVVAENAGTSFPDEPMIGVTELVRKPPGTSKLLTRW